MYKIGEFSKITSLTVKTLRYYDEVGLLKPAQVDEMSGYRYYNQDNYDKARIIHLLRRFDFSIQELLEALPRIESTDDIAAYLFDKSQQVNDRVASLKKLQKQMMVEVDKLREVKEMTNQQAVKLKVLEPIEVVSKRFKGRYDEVGNYFGGLFKAAGQYAAGAPMSLYYDEEYTEENADIEVALPVKRTLQKKDATCKVLPKERCVSLIHVGPYETLSESYKQIADYMHAHQLTGKTPSREIYHKGPGMLLKGNPNKYETEILIPIQE